MISHQLEQYIETARGYARSCRAPSTSLVCILLALMDDSEFQNILALCEIPHLDMRQVIIDTLAERVAVDGAMTSDSSNGLSSLSLFAIQAAMKKAVGRGVASAEVLDFIAAILEVHDNGSSDFDARIILMKAGLTVSSFAKARKLAASGDGDPRSMATVAMQRGNEPSADVRMEPVFTTVAPGGTHKAHASLPFCTDMTEAARLETFDRSHGREDVLSDLQIVLSRRKKRSAVLVGDPGVGKTSVVEELACRIAAGDAGPKLAGTTVLSLDVGALVGGTKYRGELEDRIKALIRYLVEHPDVILFVDEIHTLVSPTHSAGVAADLLKPALASGSIRCIGATTLAEYKKFFESDAALSRRFAPVNVIEPTRDEAVAILAKSAPSYADFHGVVIPDWAHQEAVDLSIRLMPERRLPDKALELLDDVAARAAMGGDREITKSLFAECAKAKSRRKGEAEIETAVQALGEPLVDLARAVIRNEIAAGTERSVIAVLASSTCDPKEAVLKVSEAVGRSLEYLDMAEFRDVSSVSALLGPPPGYVGFDNGGRLYDIAKRSPDCLLHLGNVDKAHPAALAIISECVSSGAVRDTTGRVANMASIQIVVSMSTQQERSRIGFATQEHHVGDTGVDLVDTAETQIVLGEVLKDRTKEAIAKLQEIAKSAGGVMSVSDGLSEHVDELLKSSDSNWKREFSRLVRNPVLDYLVSRKGNFSVKPSETGISIDAS